MAVGVLATATAAQAQTGGDGSITNIVGSAGTTVSTSPTVGLQQFGPGANSTVGNAPGSTYNSFVNVGDTAITFESANTGAGNGGSIAKTTSFSTVSFDVLNGGGAKFSSTITAAGLGFYLADTNPATGACLYTGCPQATGHTFNELLSGGTVGFDFSVRSNASDGPLYSLTGTLGISAGDGVRLIRNLGTPGNADVRPTGARSLTNFGETRGDDFDGNVSDIGLASAIGYAWDATNINFTLPDSSDQTLTYSTSVFSTFSSPCLTSDPTICLVAYSGFGDPVGRDGSVTDFSGLFGPLTSFTQPLFGTIGGINFAPTTFDLPTFGPNGVTFGEAGVPEPATWTMMIAGFGLLGAALRRRRVLAYN